MPIFEIAYITMAVLAMAILITFSIREENHKCCGNCEMHNSPDCPFKNSIFALCVAVIHSPYAHGGKVCKYHKSDKTKRKDREVVKNA